MQSLCELSPHERMLLVHAAYGKAMLRVHSIELTLATLLICQVIFSTDKGGQRESEISKIRRLPLGLLTARFVAEFSPSEALEEELSNTVFFRNELAHRISDTIISAALQENWEEKVIVELNDICGYFSDSIALLRPYKTKFVEMLGLTDKKLLDIVYAVYPDAKVVI